MFSTRAALLCLALTWTSCGSTSRCDQTCQSGCCDSAGACHSGTTDTQCGTRGQTCLPCGLGRVCTLGTTHSRASAARLNALVALPARPEAEPRLLAERLLAERRWTPARTEAATSSMPELGLTGAPPGVRATSTVARVSCVSARAARAWPASPAASTRSASQTTPRRSATDSLANACATHARELAPAVCAEAHARPAAPTSSAVLMPSSSDRQKAQEAGAVGSPARACSADTNAWGRAPAELSMMARGSARLRRTAARRFAVNSTPTARLRSNAS